MKSWRGNGEHRTSRPLGGSDRCWCKDLTPGWTHPFSHTFDVSQSKTNAPATSSTTVLSSQKHSMAVGAMHTILQQHAARESVRGARSCEGPKSKFWKKSNFTEGISAVWEATGPFYQSAGQLADFFSVGSSEHHFVQLWFWLCVERPLGLENSLRWGLRTLGDLEGMIIVYYL